MLACLLCLLPVEAVTKVVCGSSRETICLSRKLFPTPAPPVKKTLFLPSTTSRITSCCSDVSRRAALGERSGEAGCTQPILRAGGRLGLDAELAAEEVDGARARFEIGAGATAGRDGGEEQEANAAANGLPRADGGGGPPLARARIQAPSASGSALLSMSVMFFLTSVSEAFPDGANLVCMRTPPATW